MAKKNNQKLELNWIGKGHEPKLEPRILIEQPEYSYGELDSGNMLIQGDNLLALKALEQEYAGMIKCIYIDPPFNTGAAFDLYDDGIEHSLWLDLMYRRLIYLKTLLSKEGSIFIHLDDNELDYCKLLLDEVFGRSNFINRITIEARSPSAFSTVNPGVFKSSEYLLWYAKDKNLWESRSMRIPSTRDQAYSKYICNREQCVDLWNILPLKLAFLEHWNTEKIDYIKGFLEKLFFDKDSLFDKKRLLIYLEKEFPFKQIVEPNKLHSYLHGKLKSLHNISSFISFTYPYLLEKSSFAYKDKDIDDFVYNNASSVFRETEISDSGAGQEIVRLKYESIDQPNKIFVLSRDEPLDDVYVLNGKQVSFYSKNVDKIDGKLIATRLLTNIWDDVSWEGIAKEGNVQFKKGKKPEKLVQRCLQLTTNKGDFIFDSFLGSGTTASVAHKMGRKWIGIELGEHAKTHCYQRLKDVVHGEQSGISKAVGWQGGGGFKFYTLAPSLLNKDKYDNWIISREYNPDMLAAAMAKQAGFRYEPDESTYWKQGRSSEKDYIYTTTQFMTVEMLEKIKEEMDPDENLLICAKIFQRECENRYTNITIKKIPQMLLGKCEFGKEDYSLIIVNLPHDDVAATSDDYEITDENQVNEQENKAAQTNLFS